MPVIETDQKQNEKKTFDIESQEFRDANRVSNDFNAYAIGHLLSEVQFAPETEEQRAQKAQARLERAKQDRFEVILYAPLYPFGLILNTCEAVKDQIHNLISKI